MFRLALRTLRFRKGGFAATFIALFFGSALVMACGGLLETGVRTEVPPQRLAAAQVVITGDQTYEVPKNNPDDDEKDKTKSATLAERVRLDPGLVATVQSVSGVAKAIGDVSANEGVGLAVCGIHANAHVALVLIDGKGPSPIYAWKESPPKGCHECRVRVAAWNVDSLAPTSFIVPLDGKSVRRVLRPEAERGRNSSRSQVAETNEADPRHAPTVHQSWLERRRQGFRQDVRPYPKVDKQASPDHSPDAGAG